MPKVICIAGMHRSGTSMVARILNLSGLYLGPDEKMMPAAPGNNEEGFWEHLDFVKINDEILQRTGGGWDYVPDLNEKWWMNESLTGLRQEARELIESFEGHDLWGWKDPRNSITLDFWKELIPDLKVLVCLRNPLDVAASLRRRNDFSINGALHLWYSYNKRIATVTSPETRVVTDYNGFLLFPEIEMNRLETMLQIEFDHTGDFGKGPSPHLRHNRNTYSAYQNATVPLEIRTLYEQLSGEAGPASLMARASEQVEDIIPDFSEINLR